MNITDIDDKIIRRARQNHLYEKYLSETRSLENTLIDAKVVMDLFEESVKNATDPDKKVMLTNMLSRFDIS